LVKPFIPNNPNGFETSGIKVLTRKREVDILVCIGGDHSALRTVHNSPGGENGNW
jgi:hypothetical protein